MAAHVQHVVVIKFQEHTSDDQIAAFFADALEMTKHIPGITKFVHGPNCRCEGGRGGRRAKVRRSVMSLLAGISAAPLQDAHEALWRLQGGTASSMLMLAANRLKA
jgi:hypothetical protein